jgi:hypothetical protein
LAITKPTMEVPLRRVCGEEEEESSQASRLQRLPRSPLNSSSSIRENESWFFL